MSVVQDVVEYEEMGNEPVLDYGSLDSIRYILFNHSDGGFKEPIESCQGFIELGDDRIRHKYTGCGCHGSGVRLSWHIDSSKPPPGTVTPTTAPVLADTGVPNGEIHESNTSLYANTGPGRRVDGINITKLK